MSKDLTIALILTVAGHVGFLFSAEFIYSDVVIEEKEEEIPVIEIFQMPPIEPDEPEVVDMTDEAPQETVDFAPPMLSDVPSVNLDTPFVQKLQPPPPPGLERPTGIVTIPKTRPTGNIGAGMRDLFDLANLDQQPVPTFRARPVYPFEMRRAGVTGEVVVGFIVDSSGNVVQAYVVRSSHREFEQPAVQAVSRWKFRPGRKGGRAVNTRMQVPIIFSITDD